MSLGPVVAEIRLVGPYDLTILYLIACTGVHAEIQAHTHTQTQKHTHSLSSQTHIYIISSSISVTKISFNMKHTHTSHVYRDGGPNRGRWGSHTPPCCGLYYPLLCGGHLWWEYPLLAGTQSPPVSLSSVTSFLELFQAVLLWLWTVSW